ncbi:MAG: response regulator [Myxococcales bacterium]|nr:response regulator [Myxococcales bacterium]
MTRGKTILLVEDRADDVELTLRAFAKSRITHEVVVCRDGAEALDFLFARGQHGDRTELPEVVLLDLNLPKISGLDVLRELRGDERTRRLPVVVLTSSNEPQDIASSYDLGANSFMQKPVDFGAFVEAASQLGQYWLVLNKTPVG